MSQSEAYHGRTELRQARRKAGLTQTALARRLGVTCAAVSAWELGRRKPSDEHIPGLARAIGMDPDGVLRIVDHPGA